MKYIFLPYTSYLRHCFILFLLIGLAACGATTPQQTTTTPLREFTLYEQASLAFTAKDMAKAEQLYSLVVQDSALPLAPRAKAWESYIMASLANKHPYSAIENMKKWQDSVPDAAAQNAWQNAWLKIIASLPLYEQKRRTDLAIQQGSFAERVLAESYAMAQGRMSAAEQNTFIARLTPLYSQSNTNDRATLERALFNALQYASNTVLTPLSSQTGPKVDHVFPWTIIVLETLRREQLKRGPNATTLLNRINYPSLFADVSILLNVTRADISTQSAKFTELSSVCIALALPLSGPYSHVAWKVSRGASAAQTELVAAGQKLDLGILNTEQPQWLDKLAALPSQCVTVGGPMQPSVYINVKQQNLLNKRAFFTFLPQLETGDEGTIAWRFFSSPTDQIRIPLQFTKALGLHSYSILAPEEPYGKRMTELFTLQLDAAPPVATYNPADSTTWNKVTADFIGTSMVNDIPVPQTTMQAVFLPDTWQNAEIMVPYILFQGEDRLVFMGTTLWEQGLSKALQSSMQSMQLAIFPGVWNHTSPSPKAAALIKSMADAGQEPPDLWVALGYDFVRLATALSLPEDFTAEMINTKLFQAQNLDWTMAPIRWNQGLASQELFLFNPTAQGPVIADIGTFSKRLQRIYARHTRRIEKAQEEARAKRAQKRKAKPTS